MKQRIALASPAQLVVITYEILLSHLAGASAEYGTDGFAARLEKARMCLNELAAALNLEIQLAAPLLKLYTYVNQLLIRAQMENDTAPVAEAEKIAAQLLEGWRGAAGGTAPANDKSVYAGLTYTKDGALSEYEQGNPDRGYLA